MRQTTETESIMRNTEHRTIVYLGTADTARPDGDRTPTAKHRAQDRRQARNLKRSAREGVQL